MKKRSQALARAFAAIIASLVALEPICAFAASTGSITTAPGPHQPLVQAAGNGVPIVQITAPTGGLSNNVFTSFNVGPNGLIFNNSATTVSTQLSGYIPGNSFLGYTPASVILAQVTSANPSALLGYMEVAGQAANVVIANPWGITCNGCGFINTAGRATLAAGTPQFASDGSLSGFSIGSGAIAIAGAGINASNLAQLDLLAGSATFDGPTYGNLVNLIVGENEVGYTSLTSIATGAGATGTAYAVDVSSLGGMYANRIYLVATNAGLGVNNAGTISAQDGGITLAANGDVTNSGSISTSGALSLSTTGAVTNSGVAYGATGTSLTAANALTNPGTLASGANTGIVAGSISSSGTLAAGLTAAGTIGTSGDLTVSASGNVSANGTNVAAGAVTIAAPNVDVSNSQTSAGAGMSLVAQSGSLTLAGAQVNAAGALGISAAGSVDTIGAQTSSGGDTTITAGTIVENTGGTVQSAGALTVSATDVVNGTGTLIALGSGGATITASSLENSGTIASNGNVSITTSGALNNAGGTMTSGQTVQLAAPTIDNTGGTIVATNLNVQTGALTNAGGTISQSGVADGVLAVSGVLDNTNGTIQTNATDLTLAPSTLLNAGGHIEHAGSGTLTIATTNGAVDNTGGTIATGGSLALSASSVANAGGTVTADGGQITITTPGAFDNTGGTVQSAGSLQMQTAGLTNAGGGTLNALGTGGLTIDASSVSNAGGTIGSGGALALTTSGTVDNTGGVMQAAANLQLQAAALVNAGGQINALGASGLAIDAGPINNAGGTIGSNGALVLTAAGALDNHAGGEITGQQLALTAASLDNQNGLIQQNGTGDASITVSGTLDNTNGQILAAANDLGLSAGTLTNVNGAIKHSGSGTLTIATPATLLDNTGGTIASNGTIALSTAGLSNPANATINASGNLTIADTGDLANAGTIQSGGALSVSAATLENTGVGQILASGPSDLMLAVSGALTNASGATIAGNANATVSAATLTNAGIISAQNLLTVSGSTALDNASGTLTAGGDLNLSAGTLTNASGTIEAVGTASLGGTTLDNDGGAITANGIAVSATSFSNNLGQVKQLGTGATSFQLAGTLDNTNGAITTNATNATFAAGSLINTNGSIASDGSGTLALDVASGGTLQNTAAGSIESNGAIAISAPTLTNDGGMIAAPSIGITVGSLANVAGAIDQVGAAAQTISVTGALDNTNGTIKTAATSATLAAGSLTNSGTIQNTAAGALNVSTTGDLANTGSIETNGLLTLTAGGQVSNTTANGSLYGGTGLSLTAAGLDNEGGTIQTGSSTGTLAIALTGAADTSQGGIIASNGELTLDAASLNNNAGTLTALDTASLTIGSGGVTNLGGKIAATNALTLTTTGALANSGNTSIIASSGSLSVAAATIDNTNGGSIGNTGTGATTVTATTSIANDGGGTIGANVGDVTITAPTLTNTALGSLVGGSSLTLAISSLLDNEGGKAYSNGTLTLDEPGATLDDSQSGVFDASGTLSLNLAALDITNGTIQSNGDITLATAAMPTFSTSTIQAAGDLTLTLPGDLTWVAGNTVTANGTMTLNLGAGTLINDAMLTAVNGLVVNAGNVDNTAGGTIKSNATTINATGTLTNAGTIEGQTVAGNGQNIDNTGSIIGGTLTLDAGTQIANSGSSALIAGSSTINLFTPNVLNIAGANVFSLGNVSIAADGSTDANGNLLDFAQLVTNSSATVQAEGNLAISAVNLTNEETTLTIGQTIISDRTNVNVAGYTAVQYPNGCDATIFNCLPIPSPYNQGQLNYDIEVTQDVVTASSGAGTLAAGNDIVLNGAVTNENSQIAAGNSIVIGGDAISNGLVITGTYGTSSLTNIGEALNQTTNYTNGVWNFEGTAGGGFGGAHSTYSPPYPQADVTSSTQIGSVPSTVTAGQSIVVSGPVTNTTLNPSGNPISGPTATYSGGAGAITAPGSAATTGGNVAVGATSGSVSTIPATSTGSGTGTITGTQIVARQLPNGTVSVTAVAPSSATQPVALNDKITLPHNALYTINTAPGAAYLVNTNPTFANLGTYLSSNYLLGQLALDPSTVGERLGDGFYEQQFVQNEVLSQTGLEFLPGYSDNNDEYEALMNAGVMYAQQFGLQVGVGLTASQMAQLTSNMVWLVWQNVDGQEVLVPQLYLASVAPNDLTPSGALIEANNVTLHSGDLTNSGVIAATNQLQVQATTITNNGGTLSSGGDMQLAATGTVANNSGTISGGGNVLITGSNVLDATIVDPAVGSVGSSVVHAAGSISSGGNLAINGTNSVTISGANVSAGGSALIEGQNVTVNTVAENTSDAVGWISTASTSNLTSSVTSGGNLTVLAGDQATLIGAQLNSTSGALTVHGATVSIGTATDSQSESYQTSYSVGNLFSSTSGSFGLNESSTTAVGSNLSGNTVSVSSSGDTTITGSTIAGTGNVSVIAGGTLTVNTAQNTYNDQQSASTTTSGLMAANGGGLGFSIGTEKQSGSSSDTSITQVGSLIGSTSGNVTLGAVGAVNLTGTSLLATSGTIGVVGSTVDLGTAYDTDAGSQSQSQSFTGFTATVGSSVLNAGESALGEVQEAGSVQNSRLSALLDAQAAQNIGTAVSDAQMQGGLLNGGQVSLSLGTSEESSSSTSSSSTAVGTSLDAKNVAVQSTVGDITMTGGSIDATNVLLDAAQNLVFNAAQNTTSGTSDSQSSSTSLGVSMAVGGGNGKGLPTFSLSTSSSNGSSASASTQQVDAIVDASGTLSVTSGGNTTLNGAQLVGQTVIGNIAGGLDITSLQDTSTYTGSSSSFGASIGVTGNTVTGSLSLSNGSTNSTYASVVDQSGIFAGAGGYDITVGGNTNLTGGVIASTADPSLNTLSTNTITYNNVQNSASYTANTSGFGISVAGTPAGPGVRQGTGLSSSSASGNAASTTDSAISPGAITVRNDAITGQNSLAGLSTDTNNATNALNQIFNAQTVSEDQEIGDIAGQLGMTAAGNLADSLQHSGNPLFNEGGIGRDLLHGVVGGVTAALDGGNVLGSAVGVTAGAAVSNLPTILGNAGLDLNSPTGSALAYLLADAGSSVVGNAVGGAVAGSAGADGGESTSQQGVIYNLGADKPGGNSGGGVIILGSGTTAKSATPAPTAATVVSGPGNALPGPANGYVDGTSPTSSGDDAETQQFWNLVAQDNGLTAPTTLTAALAASNSSAWYAAGVGAVALNPGWGSLGGTAAGIGEVGEAGALIGGGLMSGGLLVAGAAAIAAFGGPSAASGTVGTPQPAPGATPWLTTAQRDDSFTPWQSQALYDQLAPLLGLSPTSASTSLYTPPIASLTGASDANGSQPNTQNLAAAVPNTATPPNPSGSPSPSPTSSIQTLQPSQGTLSGNPEVPEANASGQQVQAIQLQNAAGRILSQNGLNVEYLEPTNPQGQANPDLLINGETADVYSPLTSDASNAVSGINSKVNNLNQAQTIVVNLGRSSLTPQQLINQLQSTPVPNLNKVYIIPSTGPPIVFTP